MTRAIALTGLPDEAPNAPTGKPLDITLRYQQAETLLVSIDHDASQAAIADALIDAIRKNVGGLREAIRKAAQA